MSTLSCQPVSVCEPVPLDSFEQQSSGAIVDLGEFATDKKVKEGAFYATLIITVTLFHSNGTESLPKWVHSRLGESLDFAQGTLCRPHLDSGQFGFHGNR